jgi:DNA-binding response OmpR family regulator
MITWNQDRHPAKANTYSLVEVFRCMSAVRLQSHLSSHDQGSSKARILFVEDDTDTRELVRYVLTRAEFDVQLAENAEQGALLARSGSFDLYLIDNWMPGATGVDLCARLRETDDCTPILFLSGAAYEQDKRAAMAAGAQGYLTKPASMEELPKEVSRLIWAARRSRNMRLEVSRAFPRALAGVDF